MKFCGDDGKCQSDWQLNKMGNDGLEYGTTKHNVNSLVCQLDAFAAQASACSCEPNPNIGGENVAKQSLRLKCMR